MGDKNQWIEELLQSDEVGGYFQALLNNQTKELKNIILELRQQQNNEELNQLKLQLEKERSLKRDAENCAGQNQRLLDSTRTRVIELENQINDLKDANNELGKKLSNKQKEITELEIHQKELINKNEGVVHDKDDEIKNLLKNIKEIQMKLNVYEEKFSSIDVAFEKYQSLSQGAKTRLQKIFKSDSVYGIVGACSDWNNIEGIWNFTKRRIVEKEFDDVENLVFLFEFLLNANNSQSGQNRYGLIKPDRGEKFDSDIHCIIGTQTDGTVAIVRLAGIRDLESGKIIQKALIEV